MSRDLKNSYRLIPTNDIRIPSELHADKIVVVLMSGGVDSSAAALLLRDEGYCVIGLTMQITESGEDAIMSASEVCRTLSIPHFWIDLRDEFRAAVVTPFCNSYAQGETPNPCATCNERVKLGLLAQIAGAYWGQDAKIATGHYARIFNKEGETCLARAQDPKKDQSYFLAGVSRDTVQRLILPLGDIQSKEETRSLVRAANIPVSERPDSMEICFAPDKDYRCVIDAPAEPGWIVDTEGSKIGRHTGITHYTLGQRKGLGIASSHPLYVIGIRPNDNTIVAAARTQAFLSSVNAKNPNVLLPETARPGVPLYGKIRSQGEPSPCHILHISEACVSVTFETPLFAPAPGQRLVLYTEEGFVVLGSVISGAENENHISFAK